MPSTRALNAVANLCNRPGPGLNYAPILEERRRRFRISPESDRSMPSVRVKENEPFEVALRRFKRSCEKAGVLTEVRRREHFEKPCQTRKRKRAAAVKRHLKRLQREQQRFTRQY